jgi:hypothetical protein
MLNIDRITEIYCLVDDFYKAFEKTKTGHVLQQNNDKKRRNRSCNLSDSEVETSWAITLVISKMAFRSFCYTIWYNYLKVVKGVSVQL